MMVCRGRHPHLHTDLILISNAWGKHESTDACTQHNSLYKQLSQCWTSLGASLMFCTRVNLPHSNLELNCLKYIRTSLNSHTPNSLKSMDSGIGVIAHFLCLPALHQFYMMLLNFVSRQITSL